MDNIDIELASATSTPRQNTPQPSPKSPEFTGPFADQLRRLHRLRKTNPTPELTQTTRDMREVSNAIAEEAERLTQEGTPNINNASRIERREVNIGSNIVKLMRTQQVTEVQNAAEDGAQSVEQVQMTMESLNEYLSKSYVEPSNDTISRLDAIKKSMQESARAAEVLSLREEAAAGGQILDKLDVIANTHASMAQALRENVQPVTPKDAVLIQGLEKRNLGLAEFARNASMNLANSMRHGDNDVTNVMHETARDVDELLDHSFNGDDEYMSCIDELTEDVQKVAKIYTKQHQEKLQSDFELRMENAMKTPILRKYLDDSDEYHTLPEDLNISLEQNEEDIDQILKKFKQAKPPEMEELLDISMELVQDLNESIEEVEQVVIPALENAQAGAKTEEEANILQNSIAETQEHIQVLYDCLNAVGAVNASLENETSQAD